MTDGKIEVQQKFIIHLLKRSITYFKLHGVVEFTMNAQIGTIQIDDGQEAPPEPPQLWDLWREVNIYSIYN